MNQQTNQLNKQTNKKQSGEWLSRTPEINLWLPYMHVHAHTYTYTHKRTHTETGRQRETGKGMLGFDKAEWWEQAWSFMASGAPSAGNKMNLGLARGSWTGPQWKSCRLVKLKPSLHSLKPAGSFGHSFVLQLLCGPKQITFLLYSNSSSLDEGNRRQFAVEWEPLW